MKIRRDLELQRSFEVHQFMEKCSLFRSICGRGPASGKEQPFPVVMVTRIALDSMDEVTRKKKPFHSKKNELHSCSTDRERSRFVLESRQLAYLHVNPETIFLMYYLVLKSASQISYSYQQIFWDWYNFKYMCFDKEGIGLLPCYSLQSFSGFPFSEGA